MINISPRTIIEISKIVTFVLLITVLFCIHTTKQAVAQHRVQLAGVSLAGAEFGQAIPGVFGTDYIYPSLREIDYYLAKGLTTIRLPFRWERLQRVLNSRFDGNELTRLDKIINHVTSRNGSVILDPHNYARYNGYLIGSAQIPTSAFKDFWSRLARRYGANPGVIFALMNEPNTMPTEQWLQAASAAVAGIRGANATNLILVPGNGWTGAHSWQADWYGTANASMMPRVSDPLRKLAFEVHQYLDADFSGTQDDCGNAAGALAGVTRMTAWLRKHGHRAFLGEIGVGTARDCLAGLDDILTHLDANADRWLGWAYWAGGPWWGSSFMSVEPADGVDKPQMTVLREHRPGSSGAALAGAGTAALASAGTVAAVRN